MTCSLQTLINLGVWVCVCVCVRVWVGVGVYPGVCGVMSVLEKIKKTKR